MKRQQYSTTEFKRFMERMKAMRQAERQERDTDELWHDGTGGGDEGAVVACQGCHPSGSSESARGGCGTPASRKDET